MLTIDKNYTKIVKLLDEGDNTNTGSLDFEKVNDFKYIETLLCTNNDYAK